MISVLHDFLLKCFAARRMAAAEKATELILRQAQDDGIEEALRNLGEA
jgi:hypothetical protein